jgi:RNA 2',3'-cyclic 3'-phosphodiesterase
VYYRAENACAGAEKKEMRAFIAIALPSPVRTYLREIQDTLRKTGADVKWVEPENAHLTLKFLGEIDEQAAETVKTAMQESCADMGAFTISISSLGAFPGVANPRVIWIAVAQGSEQAKEISGKLETRLAPLGIQEDRPFAAHITIGRTRSSRNRKELATVLQLPTLPHQSPAPFEARSITLFKSVLSPKGPTYTSIFETPLK